tara:strand:- start:140 stop:418 length:279 start_codon:yes stop_codon:yes gene_type:complete
MITREQMVEQLNRGTCSVVFEKADGTMRTMSCTLNSSILSEKVGSDFLTEENNQSRQVNTDVIPVWDMEANAWRSFRVDSVKEFNTSSFLAG